MTDRELMQQALEALQKIYIAPEHEEYIRVWWPACEQAITALQERLAQPEPVQFKCTVVDDDHPDGVPLSKWGRHPDQEPFCYHDGRNIVGKEYADHSDVFPLYTAPQPRQWQGLTDDEAFKILDNVLGFNTSFGLETNFVRAFVRAIETKLKEKNHG